MYSNRISRAILLIFERKTLKQESYESVVSSRRMVKEREKVMSSTGRTSSHMAGKAPVEKP